MHNLKKKISVVVEFTVLDPLFGDLYDSKIKERLNFTALRL